MALAKKDTTLLGIIVVAIVVACFLGWWAYGWGVTPPPPAPAKEVATATYQPFQDFTEHPYKTGFGILAIILLAFTVYKWYPTTWDKHIVKGLVVPVAGWIMCIYFLVLISPFGEFARAHMFEAVPLIFQFALGYGVWMLNQNPKAKPLKHRLGVTLIWFTIGVLVITICAKNPVWGAKIKAVWASINTPPTTTPTPGQSVYVQTSASPSTVTLPPLTGSSFSMESNPCLERIGVKGQDVKRIKEALVEYPALLAIACRESTLNHMDPENRQQVLLGKMDRRDQGFLQFNSFYHPPQVVEKEVGCSDLKDFTCSERYGKKIYDTHGLNPWYPFGTKNESGREYKPLTVSVIAGENYGPRINIPKLTKETRFDHPDHQVTVEAESADGSKKEYTLTHRQFTDMGQRVTWVRVKRGPNETGNVGLKITYIFHPSPVVN